MGSDQLSCPGCSGNLMAGQVEGFRQYLCASCGGVVIGIAALRQLSGPAGQHIWTSEPPPGASRGPVHCPFCSSGMEPKTAPAGSAAICRACEMVWLDKQAVASLPVKATGAADKTLETEALHCDQCGAPVLHSWDEKCQYCGAALHAPTKVVVLESDAPEDSAAGALGRGGRWAEAFGMLMRPLDY